MNCNDIERILDDGDVAALGAHEHGAINEHLEVCRDCALEWQVHAQFVSAEWPPVPDSLLARCKAGFVAAARSSGRSRSRARPLVLIGLCTGAAAAALVGAGLVETGSERSSPAAASAAASVADTPDTPDTPRSPSRAAPNVDSRQSQDTGAASLPDATAASSPDSFVLAVSALHADVIDSAARSIAEAIHAELLGQLRALPDITVVETQFEQRGEPISVIYGAAPDPNVTSSASVIAAELRVVEAGTVADGTRTLTLVGRSEIVPSGDTAPTPANGNGTDDISSDDFVLNALVPEALRARMLAVTGVSAVVGVNGIDGAQSNVVNVVIDDNVANLNTVTVHGSITPALGTGSDGERGSRSDVNGLPGADIDYRLDIEATSVITTDSVNQWIVAIHGAGAGRAGSPNFDVTASGSTSQTVDARGTVERIVENLRRSVLPADAGLLDSLQRRVLDSRLTLEERLRALEELQETRHRTGVEGLDDNVVRAVTELATAATQPFSRQRLWQSVSGAKNENLVRPLIDAFLYDSNEDVRLEAARTLAIGFGDHPSVRAAFEQAAYTDDSAAIRLEASWAVRDAAAIKSYVRDTLLDASLSGDDRIAPLIFALSREALARAQEYSAAFAAGGEPSVFDITSRYTDAIDDNAAQALVEILQGLDEETRKFALVLQLARIAHPTLTRFNLETLRGNADERARANAAVALGPRLNEPGVRAGLEYAAGSDPSMLVRDAAARSLSVR